MSVWVLGLGNALISQMSTHNIYKYANTFTTLHISVHYGSAPNLGGEQGVVWRVIQIKIYHLGRQTMRPSGREHEQQGRIAR